jgi:hypothetical protein
VAARLGAEQCNPLRIFSRSAPNSRSFAVRLARSVSPGRAGAMCAIGSDSSNDWSRFFWLLRLRGRINRSAVTHPRILAAEFLCSCVPRRTRPTQPPAGIENGARDDERELYEASPIRGCTGERMRVLDGSQAQSFVVRMRAVSFSGLRMVVTQVAATTPAAPRERSRDGSEPDCTVPKCAHCRRSLRKSCCISASVNPGFPNVS